MADTLPVVPNRHRSLKLFATTATGSRSRSAVRSSGGVEGLNPTAGSNPAAQTTFHVVRPPRGRLLARQADAVMLRLKLTNRSSIQALNSARCLGQRMAFHGARSSTCQCRSSAGNPQWTMFLQTTSRRAPSTSFRLSANITIAFDRGIPRSGNCKDHKSFLGCGDRRCSMTTLTINGEQKTFDAPAEMPLLWVLRDP
jgi:hypothetical protein